MDPILVVLIILILVFGFGGWGYYSRGYHTSYPAGGNIIWLLIAVILVALVLKLLGVL